MKGQLNVEFLNGTDSLNDLDKQEIVNYVGRVLDKYGVRDEVLNLGIYLKKFSTMHLGRNLNFCNLTLSTQYGVISEQSSGWSVKKAIKDALDNAVTYMQKNAEEELFGGYQEEEIYV